MIKNIEFEKIIHQQVYDFINDTEKIKEYIKKGFDIRVNEEFLFNVKYCNHNYIIKPIEDGGEYFWKLEPYNKSFYKTFIKTGLDIIFHAIKENEELYRR